MKRRMTSDGYWEVYVPHNPMSKTRCGWLLEHRYVMSEHIDRSLTRDDIVHHKDGDKLNNDISNLELTDRVSHGYTHHGGRENDAICKQCGETFTLYRPSTIKAKGRGQFCSRECSELFRTTKLKPSKEQLIEDINTLPYTKIGKKYHVSDNAVRKWAKKYEII